MIRFIIRAAGFVLLAAAFASLVVDGTRSIAGQRILQFPLGDTVAWLGGAGFGAFLKTTAQWPAPAQQVLRSLLAIPSWTATGAAGALLLYLGRPPRSGIGFSSR